MKFCARNSTDSVQVFLDQLSQLRQRNTNPKASEIASFLEEIEELRRAHASSTPAPQECKTKITADSWISFISQFKRHYEGERRKGQFINVWEVAGIGRNEIRNSAVLAWLLSAKATHGRNDTILQNFLKKIDPTEHLPFLRRSAWADGYTLETEVYPDDLESRIDIVLQSSRALILLEIKIDSQEGANQISRYVELARAKAKARLIESAGVIYLTKVGAPGPSGGVSADIVHANWRQMQQAIQGTVGDETNYADRVLIQFARHIGQF